MTKCKFSVSGDCHLSHGSTECNGSEEEKECCPFWAFVDFTGCGCNE